MKIPHFLKMGRLKKITVGGAHSFFDKKNPESFLISLPNNNQLIKFKLIKISDFRQTDKETATFLN
jgi:hypothetical protein